MIYLQFWFVYYDRMTSKCGWKRVNLSLAEREPAIWCDAGQPNKLKILPEHYAEHDPGS